VKTVVCGCVLVSKMLTKGFLQEHWVVNMFPLPGTVLPEYCLGLDHFSLLSKNCRDCDAFIFKQIVCQGVNLGIRNWGIEGWKI